MEPTTIKMTKRAKPGQGERAAYKAKWYRTNKARILARQRRYKQEHREERMAYQLRYERKRHGWKPWRKGGPGRPPMSAEGREAK